MKIPIFCAALCFVAIQAFAQTSDSADKDSAESLFSDAVALAEQGKNDEALAILNRLMADYPELPEPYNNAAVLYAKKKEWQRAMETLKIAIAANPQFARAHQNLGFLYLELARQAFQTAEDIAPGSATQELQRLNNFHQPLKDDKK